ncbi:hypothetical protein TPHA_0G01100 [Tetrapisispora phaffii CBS 4417]|uniref:Cytochrome c oxidase assembly factor 6 n=1 Tax=Tetrapisispora phaffii (strain ATCC 24235 / CBS 4417 / NBRC 1672 / NRRL Y-8282 / UCD 70-5) TaxID=1071381 RepID=G8BVL9_TETPH|nr:hypothetical protein TPHA_0G01100 [Tetrapisispora phaffii CBS 4417]CCE63947.1 hypothetical protein TPHA_0G01100 [Tetrapisispora phaffii CBS 4417]
MGWLFGDNRKKVNTRQEREKCWESRDLFFGCLDKNNILDVRTEKNSKLAKSACSAELKGFENNCSNSWIKYFKEKRVVDFKKKKIEQEMIENNIQPLNLSPQQYNSMQKK